MMGGGNEVDTVLTKYHPRHRRQPKITTDQNSPEPYHIDRNKNNINPNYSKFHYFEPLFEADGDNSEQRFQAVNMHTKINYKLEIGENYMRDLYVYKKENIHMQE